MFTDKVKITIKSGDGGDGMNSFKSFKGFANGGPDGGDGGKGGDVYVVGDKDKGDLTDFRFGAKFTAGDGERGGTNNRFGKGGEDVVISLPLGTLVRDAETGRILCDVYTDGEKKLIARGGNGGKGNVRFTTARRHAPHFAQKGEKTQVHTLILELKVIADVGIIGFPNVGKSTLLSKISAARPKIANYHFTTLSPNLGAVKYYDQSFIAADIPGLIEGASAGLGLGHDFLRHVDRCRLLVHVVDIAGSEGRDPIEDVKLINGELRQYSEDLASRPQILAANKCDLLDPDTAEKVKAEWEAFAASLGCETIYISAASGENVKTLCRKVYERLQSLSPITIYEPEYEQAAQEPPMPDDITARLENGTWYVEGDWLKWLMSGINFDDRESFMYFEKMLREKGIIEKMRELGIRDGDTVSLYDLEFDFVD